MAITINNGLFNVWYREPATGTTTVVLIHGLTGTSRWWTRVISHLPDDLGLIALDARGRGESWNSPGPYDLKTIADDVARCLDHFGLRRAPVAGYSMGGWVAALFAGRHPERAERLVLVDGGLPIEVDHTLSREEILDQVVGPAVTRLAMEFETLMPISTSGESISTDRVSRASMRSPSWSSLPATVHLGYWQHRSLRLPRLGGKVASCRHFQPVGALSPCCGDACVGVGDLFDGLDSDRVGCDSPDPPIGRGDG